MAVWSNLRNFLLVFRVNSLMIIFKFLNIIHEKLKSIILFKYQINLKFLIARLLSKFLYSKL